MKKLIVCLISIIFIASGGLLYAGSSKTESWNASFETTPGDNDNISEGAQRIRELKRDIRERFAEDHFMDLAGVQADQGEHSKITFHEPLTSDPTAVSNKGFLYTKDVSSKAELYYEDEDGNTVRLTKAGAVFAFPVGTKMLFYQDSCPIGWTIDTTVNDGLAMLTKGSGASGEPGGQVLSSSTWTQPSHTHTGPSHTHTTPNHVHKIYDYTTLSGVDYIYDSNGNATILSHRSSGVSGSHIPGSNSDTIDKDMYSDSSGGSNTGSSGTGNTGSSATANTWRPHSYNVIVCTKD